MGGGGSEGRVAFPSYVENFHNDMLVSASDGNINNADIVLTEDALGNAHTANPYESGPAAVSTAQLETTIDEWFRKVRNNLESLDNLQDWKDALDEGVKQIINNAALDDLDPHNNLISNARSATDSEIDAAITKAQNAATSGNISNLVSNFETRVNSRLDERKRSITSLYADVNAVHSSGFLISQALLERDASREVNKLEKEQLFEVYKDTLQAHIESYVQHLGNYLQAESQNKQADDQFLQRATQQMYKTSRQDFQLNISERQARQQVASADWEARQAAEEFELSLDEKAGLWELNTLERGANILAGPGGMGARLPPESSDTSKAIGGALTGAASGAGAGASIGAAGGPIGAGAGALIGAGMGAVSGLV